MCQDFVSLSQDITFFHFQALLSLSYYIWWVVPSKIIVVYDIIINKLKKPILFSLIVLQFPLY